MNEKLPDGWEWKKLGNVARIGAGNGAPQGDAYYNNGIYPFVRTFDVGKEGQSSCLKNPRDKINNIALNDFKMTLWPAKTLLIPKSGASTFLNHRVLLGEPAYVSSHLATVVADELLIPEYLYYWSLNLDAKHLTPNTNYPSLKLSDIESAIIPLPPLDVQQKIVSILEKAEETRRLRAQADELTLQLLKSVFLEMFGNPVRNEKGWAIKKVGDVIASMEAGWSANGEQRLRERDEYGVLKVSSVTQGFFLPEEHKAIKENIDLKKVVTPEMGDVIFSRANTLELVGATCLIRANYPKLLLPDKLWKIRVNTDLILPEVFKFILAHHSMRAEISKKSTGTSGSMYNISMAKLQSILIPVPPLEVQDKFSLFYDKFEIISEQQAQSSQQITTLFDSLMQKAFTGELVS